MQEARLVILRDVEEYLAQLTENELGKVDGALKALKRRDFDKISIKQQKGKIKELRVNVHRLIFFEKLPSMFVVVAFRKTSAKAPRRYIEHAERIYYSIIERMS